MTLGLVLILAACSAIGASETGLSGTEGHPRGRFPLALYVMPVADTKLNAEMYRAVAGWNGMSQEVLGLQLFRLVEQEADAQVLISLESGTSPNEMGEVGLCFGEGGVITLPVRIVVFQPSARGQTAAETVLYQVVAHELGHALGLDHTTDPRSIMCCVKGSVDFKDPVTRQAYLEARRHPDIRSAESQLRAHYGRFWSK